MAEVHARVRITGQTLVPEEITERTLIAPSRIWHKGDVVPKTIMKSKDNGWELVSELSVVATIDEHMSHLLSVLDTANGSFVEFTQRYLGLVSFAVYVYDDRPVIYFDRRTVKRLAELCLELDVDMYHLGENR